MKPRPTPSHPHYAKKGLPAGSLIHVGSLFHESSGFTYHTFSADAWKRETDFNRILDVIGKKKEQASWLEVTGLSDIIPLKPIFESLSISPLLSEDILNTVQNSKTEIQPNLILQILKNIVWKSSDLSWEAEQLSLLLKPDIFISFSEKESALMNPIFQRMEDPESKSRSHGQDYTFYAVTDLIVDGYLEICENLDSCLEEIEIKLDAQSGFDPTADLHQIKKFLVYFRHQVLPVKDGISRLLKDPGGLISPDDFPYYQDILDHTSQVIIQIDQVRENLNGIRELYLSQLSIRMNKVIQLLTLVSTIFIPLTFLAGVYGMNFSNMPELTWKFGYPAVLLAMLLIGIGFYLYYRRKKWL